MLHSFAARVRSVWIGLTCGRDCTRLHSFAVTLRCAQERRSGMDDRVASAIAHWAPRFTANGVTPADFARVTASVETWPEWGGAWVAGGEQHEALGREALAEG